MDANEFRAEFRTRIVETWLLYAITYEMSIEKATIFLGKIESQALLDFPDWKRAGARRPVIEELLERLGEIEASTIRKRFPEGSRLPATGSRQDPESKEQRPEARGPREDPEPSGLRPQASSLSDSPSKEST